MTASRPQELAARQARLREDAPKRRACLTCSPAPPGRVPMDRLWAWSLAHPGESPFR